MRHLSLSWAGAGHQLFDAALASCWAEAITHLHVQLKGNDVFTTTSSYAKSWSSAPALVSWSCRTPIHDCCDNLLKAVPFYFQNHEWKKNYFLFLNLINFFVLLNDHYSIRFEYFEINYLKIFSRIISIHYHIIYLVLGKLKNVNDPIFRLLCNDY